MTGRHFIGCELWARNHMYVIVVHSDSFCAIVHNTRLHNSMPYIYMFANVLLLGGAENPPMLAIPVDDDSTLSPAGAVEGAMVLDDAEQRNQVMNVVNDAFFFFKPVEGSMGHHTVLGDQPIEFDCIAQPFRAKAAEFTGAEMNSVTLFQSGSPLTFCLTNIQFDVLSKNLFVWTEMDIDYRVILAMLLDL